MTTWSSPDPVSIVDHLGLLPRENALAAPAEDHARFYSFTTWAGSSYTLNTDIYLSVSAAINVFLLLGLLTWVVTSAQELALRDKAYFERHDGKQAASTDIVEHSQQYYDHGREEGLRQALTEQFRWQQHEHPNSPGHDESVFKIGASLLSSRPDTVDDILGYISRSRDEALNGDSAASSSNAAGVSAELPGASPQGGYANYAQYLASVYGYRTGEPEEEYSQRTGSSAAENRYRVAKAYRSPPDSTSILKVNDPWANHSVTAGSKHHTHEVQKSTDYDMLENVRAQLVEHERISRRQTKN